MKPPAPPANPCCEPFILSNSPIVRDVLDNGLRILTERMTQVRSISIGVWLTRGSRHETAERGGIAHFVEHMLFKGTARRSAEDIAQAIDSIGGQLDAFTAKEYASYYIKVLDEHLPLAIDILSDIVLNPAFSPADIEARRRSGRRDQDGRGHAGRSCARALHTRILGESSAGPAHSGRPRNVDRSARTSCATISSTSTPPNLIVSAVETSSMDACRSWSRTDLDR